MNGVLQMTGTYNSSRLSVKVGNFQYFYKDGTLSMEGIFVNNKQEGIWKDYDTTGNLKVIENFREGELHGDFMAYYSNGILKRKENYEYGKFISGKCFDEKEQEITFFPYNQPAEFEGGRAGLMAYLSDNLVYPEKARLKRIQGKVWLRFIIDVDGSVSNVRVTRSIHTLLDAEAISVVKSMPTWIPGKIDDVPVKSYFDLPINFVLTR